jgi:hypothetical protein
VIPCETLTEVRTVLGKRFGRCKTRSPVYVDGADGLPKRVGTVFSRIGHEYKGTGRRARLYVQDWVTVFALRGHDEQGQPDYEYRPVIRLVNPA